MVQNDKKKAIYTGRVPLYIAFFKERDDNMTVDIICPLYNASLYIDSLHKSLLKQKNVTIKNIQYILTESHDSTEEYLQKNYCQFFKIKKEDFSHSLVRETAAMQSTADIICFISQDIVIEREDWLENLVFPIIHKEVEATYSRQLTKFNNIEKYTRENNYPSESRVKSKNDLEQIGLKTFFFSDAASAIRRDVFVKLNGYDGKNLLINEDMYFAYKLIMNGYKIKYCADSVVFHSHNFTLKELYNRYKLTGQFFKENSYLDKYGTISSGSSLAKYILKRAIQDKNIKVLLRYPFDMIVRLLGMKVGKK